MKKLLLILCLAFLGASLPANGVTAAGTWTVCASGCDFTTIQAAVDAAAPGDTLQLSGETFVENVTIDKSLKLQGAGQAVTVVDGGGTGNVITVVGPVAVTLEKMTLQNGSGFKGGGISLTGGSALLSYIILQRNTASHSGGAISVIGGSLTLKNGLVIENDAIVDGGALYNEGGTIKIQNSRFIHNTTDGSGGAVYMLGGQLTAEESTFRANASVYSGGGILNSFGRLVLIECTISDNVSGFAGGGVYHGIDHFGGGGPLTIDRSTFSGNTTVFAGGGMYVNGNGAQVKITNSTFNRNSATQPLYGIGGAIYTSVPLSIANTTFFENAALLGTALYPAVNDAISIQNTIIAGGGPGEACALSLSSIVVGGNNLVDDDSCSFPANPVTGFDPALANNGGPTWTHALLPGSNAIDAGDPAVCAARPVNGIDQRGRPRTGGTCDIGAFELQPGD